MLSLDLSTTNIFLTVAVVALFIFFIVLLIKLNPSIEKNENLETEIEVEEQQPIPISTIAPQNPPPARVDVPREHAEKPLIAVSPTMGGFPVQAKQESQAPTFGESREIPKPEKIAVPAKNNSVPSKKDCVHHFGYLRTFPKNSPIPDECFGCERIVDCLVHKKTR